MVSKNKDVNEGFKALINIIFFAFTSVFWLLKGLFKLITCLYNSIVRISTKNKEKEININFNKDSNNREFEILEIELDKVDLLNGQEFEKYVICLLQHNRLYRYK